MAKKLDFNKIINRLILFISIGVLAHLLFLLSTTDREILLEVRKIKFRYLLIIGGLVMVPWVGHATRLVLWTRFLNQPLTFRKTFKVAVSTDLGAALTPTLIGGGPIKLAMLLKNKIPPAKAGILIALGGFEDLVFYLSGITLAFFFAFDSISKIGVSIYTILSTNIIPISITSIVICLYILLRRAGVIKYKLSLFDVFPPNIRKKIFRILIGIRKSYQETKSTLMLVLRSGKLTFLFSFTILVIQWFAKFSILFILLKALDIDVSFLHIYLKQWLVWLTMIFIPTPGATGGAEASFYLLFDSSIPSEVLALIVSTWRFFTYYFVMLSAVFIFQTSAFWALRQKKLAA